MKIRIQGNFIRYRLTQSEVKALSVGEKLAESTCFGPGPGLTFVYALEPKAEISTLEASFADGKITLFIPDDAARTWYADARVGFEHKQEVAPGVFLGMLLEKDFACLDDTEADKADKYPNPNLEC
jgi:hypothetical protein